MKKKPTEPTSIRVNRDSPRFCEDVRELEKAFPGVKADVEKCLNETVLPALRANPIQPHLLGAGTPLTQGVYHVRVNNESGGSGDRGGFRMRYHWDRHEVLVTLLDIKLRRDDSGVPRKAVKKLIEKAKSARKK